MTGPLAIRRSLDRLLNGHNYAKAAIDIAIHDLIGKAHGIRVCDLLGGATSDRVSSYYALSVDEPDDVARTAAEKIAEGYPRLQIKVGGRPVETRHRDDPQGVGGHGLHPSRRRRQPGADHPRRPPHRPGVRRHPVRLRTALQHHGGDRRDPRAAAPRVYLDENTENLNSVLRAISLGICDGFGLKVTRLGGLGTMATVRDICESRSMPHTCDDSWGGDIIAAACVHIGATVQPRLLEGVWLAEPYMDVHYDSDNPVRVEEGTSRCRPARVSASFPTKASSANPSHPSDSRQAMQRK